MQRAAMRGQWAYRHASAPLRMLSTSRMMRDGDVGHSHGHSHGEPDAQPSHSADKELAFSLSKSAAAPKVPEEYMQTLHTVANPASQSALSAFAYRVCLAMEETESSPLVHDLGIVERCLLDASFVRGARWLKTHETPQVPTSVILAALDEDKREPVARLLDQLEAKNFAFTQFNDDALRDNSALAGLGGAYIQGLATELIAQKFPHLPTRFLKQAVDFYTGDAALAGVAEVWGIAPSEFRYRRPHVRPTDLHRRMTRAQKSFGHLLGGAGVSASVSHPQSSARDGLVRWVPEFAERKPAHAFNERFAQLQSVLARAVRAFTGAIVQHSSFETARAFVYAHALSRLTASASSTRSPPLALGDIAALIKFDDPVRALSDACFKYSLPTPHHRLLQETGRLSNHPVFLCGVYAGDLKLGEGTGDSLRMANFRASENALRRLYLSTSSAQALGEPPSAAWAGRLWAPIEIADSPAPRESRSSNVGKTLDELR